MFQRPNNLDSHLAVILMTLYNSLSGGLSQPRYPLLNQCHVMSRLAEDLTRGFSQYYSGTSLNCSLMRQKLPSPNNNPLDCIQILCRDDLDDLRDGINFTLQLLPCSSPPAVRVTQQVVPQTSGGGPGNFVNATLSSSEIFALNLGGESTSAFLFFGISQHTNRLSLGFEVS
jgi:hypothetical protein